MKNTGIIIQHKYKEHFNLLTDEELGKLMRGILEYEINGTIPDFEGMLKMAFSFIKTDLDNNNKKYVERCKKMKENADKRWQNENANAENKMQLHNEKCNCINENANDANINLNLNKNKKENISEHTSSVQDVSRVDSIAELESVNQERVIENDFSSLSSDVETEKYTETKTNTQETEKVYIQLEPDELEKIQNRMAELDAQNKASPHNTQEYEYPNNANAIAEIEGFINKLTEKMVRNPSDKSWKNYTKQSDYY